MVKLFAFKLQRYTGQLFCQRKTARQIVNYEWWQCGFR